MNEQVEFTQDMLLFALASQCKLIVIDYYTNGVRLSTTTTNATEQIVRLECLLAIALDRRIEKTVRDNSVELYWKRT